MSERVPAYYCIIQYTPSQYRMEVVNVGVVLFCPELSYLGVQITALYDRAERFFPDIEGSQVRSNARSISYRLLHIEAEYMRTLDDLRHFVDTRANQIVLTQPRPMTLDGPLQEVLLRLFRELVDDRPEALVGAGAEPRPIAVPPNESPAVAVPTNP